MFVVQLIGRLADSVVEMPFHVAQSNIASGTCRLATDDEIRYAGLDLIPHEAPDLLGDDVSLPRGFTVEPTEGYGFDLYDAGRVRLNTEPYANIAAARSAANEVADLSLQRQPASDILNHEVMSDQIQRRPIRTFTMADYQATQPDENGNFHVLDFNGVQLTEDALPSLEEARGFAAEHLRLALSQGEGPTGLNQGGDDRELEIPKDWKTMHHMKRRALARLIIGEELPNVAAADAAIEDYIRAKAV